jgi:hypothetical protein
LVLGIVAAVAPTGLHGSFGRSFAVAGAWLVVAGALALVWPARVDRRWMALIGAVITVDLVLAGAGLNPSTDSSIYQNRTGLVAAASGGHRLYLFPEAERELKFERTHRFDSFQADLNPWLSRASGLPNTTMLDRLASANNFDPLLPSRYVGWISALAAGPAAGRTERLRLMDVGWTADAVDEKFPWVTYEAVPGSRRAWLMPVAVTAASSFEALDGLNASSFDPARAVLLEAPESVASQVGGKGTVDVRRTPDPGRVIIDVVAPLGGWVMLSDTWYPGWTALVDGAPANSYPADGVFRAVWAPPGTSTVEWVYRPDSFRLGLVVTALSGVVLAVVVLLWLVRRRSA